MSVPAEHEKNRKAWNEATPAHNSHKGDQARFFQDGGSTLYPEETELLGSVDGMHLLHLQCNCGQDSISMAQLGAAVTGVDISDEAVEFASRLALESGIHATFVRSDVVQFCATTDQRFDRVISTYGCIMWLNDLKKWAAGISRVLKPGGRFVLVEYHPAALVFDHEWQASNPYSSNGKAVVDVGVPDYVGMSGAALVPWGFQEGVKDFRGKCETCEYYWSLSDIMNAALNADLTLTQLEEYPFCNGAPLFEDMEEKDGRWYPTSGRPQVPMMFGVVFEKK